MLQYHTLMITTKLLWEQKMIIIDGTMKEEDVIVMLQDMIQSANDHHLDIEVCSNQLVIHQLTLH